MSEIIIDGKAHQLPQDTTSSVPTESVSESSESEEEVLRIGKDEMNLVEYPFAALSREVRTDAVIEHEWETRHPVFDVIAVSRPTAHKATASSINQ